MFRRLYELLTGLFLPFLCHLCRAETGSTTVICAACRKRLDAAIGAPSPVPDAKLPAWSLGTYNSILGEAVKIIKYRPSPRLLEVVKEMVTERLTVAGPSGPWVGDVLVPAPMHAARQADRGFNQADQLAAAMGSAWRRPVVDALMRQRVVRPQAECDERERLSNLEGVVVARPSVLESGRLTGKRLILVDDVTTTGTTLAVCAAALQPFRPAAVQALVLAHQPRKF